MINSSISGSTIIFKAPIKGGDRGSYGMSGTYKELIAAGFPQNYSYENRILPFSDAELVVIDHGHNDQSRIETDLGTLDGTDKTTFYGAYNTVINAVIAANPKARIILCTPPNGWMHGGEGDASGYKVLLHKVADAIRELGKYRGIPVLDFQANANIHSRNQKVWTTDGVHPNNAATKRLATIGYRFLLTID